MSIPRFAVDGEHRAALIIGRGLELGPLSVEQIEACVDAAAQQAREAGLPLAFVIATQPEDGAYGGAAAGFLIAETIEGAPCEVPKAALTGRAPADVPQSLWDALAAAGATFPAASEDDDPEAPREGLFLVPGGWSIANLRLGRAPTQGEIEDAEAEEREPPEDTSEHLLSVAAEDTDAARVLDAALIARIQASSEPLYLDATYC